MPECLKFEVCFGLPTYSPDIALRHYLEEGKAEWEKRILADLGQTVPSEPSNSFTAINTAVRASAIRSI